MLSASPEYLISLLLHLLNRRSWQCWSVLWASPNIISVCSLFFMIGMTVVAGAFSFWTFSQSTLDSCVMRLSRRLFCSGAIQRNTAFFHILPRSIAPFHLLTLHPSFVLKSFVIVHYDGLFSVYTRMISCQCVSKWSSAAVNFVDTIFFYPPFFPDQGWVCWRFS